MAFVVRGACLFLFRNDDIAKGQGHPYGCRDAFRFAVPGNRWGTAFKEYLAIPFDLLILAVAGIIGTPYLPVCQVSHHPQEDTCFVFLIVQHLGNCNIDLESHIIDSTLVLRNWGTHHFQMPIFHSDIVNSETKLEMRSG